MPNFGSLEFARTKAAPAAKEFVLNCGLIALQLWWNFCDWWKRQSTEQKLSHLVFAVIVITVLAAVYLMPYQHSNQVPQVTPSIVESTSTK